MFLASNVSKKQYFYIFLWHQIQTLYFWTVFFVTYIKKCYYLYAFGAGEFQNNYVHVVFGDIYFKIYIFITFSVTGFKNVIIWLVLEPNGTESLNLFGFWFFFWGSLGGWIGVFTHLFYLVLNHPVLFPGASKTYTTL